MLFTEKARALRACPLEHCAHARRSVHLRVFCGMRLCVLFSFKLKTGNFFGFELKKCTVFSLELTRMLPVAEPDSAREQSWMCPWVFPSLWLSKLAQNQILQTLRMHQPIMLHAKSLRNKLQNVHFTKPPMTEHPFYKIVNFADWY